MIGYARLCHLILIASTLVESPALAAEPWRERWPANVCAEIGRTEQADEDRLARAPLTLAIMRTDLLIMLRLHCGVKFDEKLVDDAALVSEAMKRLGE